MFNNNRGGRSRGRGRSGGRGYQSNHPKPKLIACREYTSKGDCKFGNSCTYAHVLRNHAQIDLPMNNNNNQHHQSGFHQNRNQHNNNGRPAVSSVALWETQGAIKFFIGSHDGYWRLYNTNGFTMEFENLMGDGKGKVECVEVASNYLFCAFEGISTKLPKVKVGMVHAWNLNSPQDPPLEFHISELAPYAHSNSVSCLITASGAVISGCRNGTIRIWQYNPALEGGKGGFALSKTLHGHVREITGLTIVNNSILWSSSLDHSLRIWDLNTGECKHLICKPAQNGQVNSVGHDNAVTSLLTFENELGKFVLSGSLDGTVKAWNGETGECLASENHNQGVISMALNTDVKGIPIVLCGLEDGTLMIRNMLQTQNLAPFTLLVAISNFSHNNVHESAIQSIKSGPSNTFYTGGRDGKLLVWQITGDLSG